MTRKVVSKIRFLSFLTLAISFFSLILAGFQFVLAELTVADMT
jgi:hypothetical protein